MWGYVVASGSKVETIDGKWGQVGLSETKRMLVVVCRGMWRRRGRAVAEVRVSGGAWEKKIGIFGDVGKMP